MALEPLAGLIIAVYARFSSSKQRDTSIEDQLALCREYIVRHGGTVQEDLILVDRALSGTTTAGRRDYDKLLALIDRKAVDLVVTESGDRLNRDLGDADRLWKMAEFKMVRLILVSDGIDSAREGSRTAFRFKALMSDEYIQELGKKTMRGLLGAFGRDWSTGGLPYGYSSELVHVDGKEGYQIKIDPEAAETVKQIFTWYAEGQSLLSIAKLLNEAAIPPPRAKHKQGADRFWRKSTLSMLLGNRTYLGEFTFGRRKWGKHPTTGKRVYTKQAAFQTDTRRHLAIIPRDLWSRVTARKAAVANNLTRKKGNSGRKTAHPYAGLLFCGVCGASFMDVGGSATRYYRCRGAVEGGKCSNVLPVREDLLNAVAMAELNALVANTNTWAKIERQIEERMKVERFETIDQHTKLKKAIQAADTAIDRLVAFITTTDQTSASYGVIRAKLDAVVQKKKEAELALASLNEAPNEGPRTLTAHEAMAMCRDIEARVKSDPSGFREFMRSAFLADGRITLDPQPDGSYLARSRILPLRLPAARTLKTKTPETTRVPGASGLVGPVRCGGRI